MILYIMLILQAILLSDEWNPDIDLDPKNEIAWSATDDQFAIATTQGLWIYDFLNEEAHLISDCGTKTYNPVFHQDGKTVAYSTSDGSIYVIDRVTGEELAQSTTQRQLSSMGYIDRLLFMPNASQLIIAHPASIGSKIVIWDYQDDEILITSEAGQLVIDNMILDSNTDVIWISGSLFGTDVGQSFFWGMEIKSGNIIIYLPPEDTDASGVRMDNGLYAYSVKDHLYNGYYFYIGNIKHSADAPYTSSYDTSIFDFDISNDANLLAMITWTDRIRIIQLYRLGYKLDIQRDNDLRTVLFDSKGEHLAVQTWGELPEVEIWDMETMTQSMTLRTADWYQADCGE